MTTYAVTRPSTAEAAYPYASAPQNSSDAALLERIAKGDQLGMRTLYARHHVLVYRFVLRILRDQLAAEDVLSEVFLDVWRQAKNFEGRSSVATWLLAIARYKSLSILRRRSEIALDDELAEAIHDPADTPELALLKKDQAALLRQAIAELPPNQTEVLDLVYYHGKTVAEVAQISGIPEATVKTRMFYARKKLAELVKAA